MPRRLFEFGGHAQGVRGAAFEVADVTAHRLRDHLGGVGGGELFGVAAADRDLLHLAAAREAVGEGVGGEGGGGARGERVGQRAQAAAAARELDGLAAEPVASLARRFVAQSRRPGARAASRAAQGRRLRAP